MVWLARASVGAVFAVNVSAAVSFLSQPERFAPGFELHGVGGAAVVQGIGVLFLMWNATYPPVIAQPLRQRSLFLIVLIQQAIGVVGESWIWLRLPAGHAALTQTGLRFLLFDGIGLLAMGVAYLLSRPRPATESERPPASQGATSPGDH